MRSGTISLLVAASAAAIASAASSLRVGAPKLTQLFSQHEPASVYESAGVSSAGFVAAATWLNEPEVAEIFDALSGNKTIKSIGDSNPLDGSMFHISMATAGTTAIVSKTQPNGFYSTLYLFDTKTTGVLPEWNMTLENSEVFAIAMSSDGSTAAVAAYGLGPVVRVIAIDTATGEQKPEYTWQMPKTTTAMQISLSANGDFMGVLAGSPEGITIDVVHATGTHHGDLTNATLASDVGQAFAISPDGKYVAAGQAFDLYVWKQTSMSPITYEVDTHEQSTTHYVSAGTISFAPDTPHMSVAWQTVTGGISQNIVQMYDLSTSKALLNASLPQQNGQYPNWPVQTGVSAGGKFVVYCSWGAEGQQAGAAQLQVFTGDGPSSAPAVMYTPGSMFACGIGQQKDGTVVAAAAGKHVHATIMGNGGDMYAVKVETQ